MKNFIPLLFLTFLICSASTSAAEPSKSEATEEEALELKDEKFQAVPMLTTTDFNKNIFNISIKWSNNSNVIKFILRHLNSCYSRFKSSFSCGYSIF